MSRYDTAKFWKPVKGRKSWTCDRCGAAIAVGEHHWVESLGLINPGPGMTYARRCAACGVES